MHSYVPYTRQLPKGVKQLPAESRKQLHFRFHDSVHEYNCVRNAFLRAGMLRTDGSNWNALWSKHLTEAEFLRLNPHQKVNHFPGSWGLGRKDRLARNLGRMAREFGSAYAISSRTFYLPKERRKLIMEMEADPKVSFRRRGQTAAAAAAA